MEGLYLGIACVWIIVGNAWHALLIASRKKSGPRPLTISEHAVENNQLLLIHRIVHSAPVFVFSPLIFAYLLPKGHYVAAVLLGLAAVFDCLETLSLNKHTAPLSSHPNIHSLTAWLMAASYFMYSLAISIIAGLSIWIYSPVLLLSLVLVVCANKGISKKKSLAMQMTYFILVSLVGLMAHIKLIFLS